MTELVAVNVPVKEEKKEERKPVMLRPAFYKLLSKVYSQFRIKENKLVLIPQTGDLNVFIAEYYMFLQQVIHIKESFKLAKGAKMTQEQKDKVPTEQQFIDKFFKNHRDTQMIAQVDEYLPTQQYIKEIAMCMQNDFETGLVDMSRKTRIDVDGDKYKEYEKFMENRDKLKAIYGIKPGFEGCVHLSIKSPVVKSEFIEALHAKKMYTRIKQIARKLFQDKTYVEKINKKLETLGLTATNEQRISGIVDCIDSIMFELKTKQREVDKLNEEKKKREEIERIERKKIADDRREQNKILKKEGKPVIKAPEKVKPPKKERSKESPKLVYKTVEEYFEMYKQWTTKSFKGPEVEPFNVNSYIKKFVDSRSTEVPFDILTIR